MAMGGKLLPEGQETYEGLEQWLKTRRDQYVGTTNAAYWNCIDELLGEVRDAGAEGFLPWQTETTSQ